MDLTVAATPFYFASMEVERRWLKARVGDERFDAGQFEPRDTRANLAMGTASLVAPMGAMFLRRKLELGRGRWAKPVLATGLAAAVATTAADRVVDRRRRRAAERVAAAQRPRLELVVDVRDGGAVGATPAAPTEAVDDTVTQVARGVALVGSVVAVGALGAVTASTWAAKMSTQRLWEHRRIDLGTGAKGLAAAIVGWDFIYYWNHRFMHESRYMWAIHVVHHSSERYNLSVALRQPVADALGTFVPYGLMCLAGVSPALVETARGINLIYQYWIHTESIPKLGAYEELFNTASLHRVHHGTNRQYIDRNHGGILILWDRLFGTHEPEGDRVIYGLTTNLDSFSPVRIATAEHVSILRDVARSTSWRDRLSYIFRGPGWAYERHRELGLNVRPDEAPAAA